MSTSFTIWLECVLTINWVARLGFSFNALFSVALVSASNAFRIKTCCAWAWRCASGSSIKTRCIGSIDFFTSSSFLLFRVHCSRNWISFRYIEMRFLNPNPLYFSGSDNSGLPCIENCTDESWEIESTILTLLLIQIEGFWNPG